MILSKLQPSPVPSKIHFNAMFQPASWFSKWTFLHHDSAYITSLFILAACPAHRDLMDCTILTLIRDIHNQEFPSRPTNPFWPHLMRTDLSISLDDLISCCSFRRGETVWTAAINGPTVHPPDDMYGGMILTGGNRRTTCHSTRFLT
jgi:hypothetical protein